VGSHAGSQLESRSLGNLFPFGVVAWKSVGLGAGLALVCCLVAFGLV